MTRWLCVTAALAAVIGCGQSAAPRSGPPAPPAPPPVSQHPLVGLSIDQLKSDLGPPASETRQERPFDFGPHPEGLGPGDPYTYLYYSDYQGEQLHVFCVSPELYSRIRGESPGRAKAYVLAVFAYPKGTVF